MHLRTTNPIESTFARGIQLVTVWQDFAQIQALYDRFSPTVINNHRAKVILSGVSDPPTLDYITRLVGDQPITETSTTRQGDGNIRSVTESRWHWPLATTGALRQAETGSGVLVYGNLHPAQLRLRRPPHRNRRAASVAPPPTTPGEGRSACHR